MKGSEAPIDMLVGSGTVCSKSPVVVLYSSRKTGAVVSEHAAAPAGEGQVAPLPTRSSSSELVWKRHAVAPALLLEAQAVQVAWPAPA